MRPLRGKNYVVRARFKTKRLQSWTYSAAMTHRNAKELAQRLRRNKQEAEVRLSGMALETQRLAMQMRRAS